MSELTQKSCTPCTGSVPRLGGKAIDELHAKLGSEWTVVDQHHLTREYRFQNFRQALDLTVHIGELAEREGHHPDICLSWGRVKLTIWTHKVDGLTESDFVLAAKADEQLEAMDRG